MYKILTNTLYNTNFRACTTKPVLERRKMPLNKEELMEKLTQTAIMQLIAQTDWNGRNNNPTATEFDIPETNNVARITLKKDETSNIMRVTTSVRHKERDKTQQNPSVKVGTKEDISAFLKSDEGKKRVIDSIEELSDETDKLYAGPYI